MSRQTGAVARSPVVRVSAAVGSDDGERAVAAARDAAASVPVVRTGPTGIAEYDPLLAATADGRTALVPAQSPETAGDAAAALAEGTLPTEAAAAVVEHEPEAERLPTPDSGPLSVGRRATLGPCGWVDPLSPADLSLVSPEATAAETGILGRGRGDAAVDEPVEETWASVRAADGDPVVVVVANDFPGGQDGDRLLLAAAPLAVLDGAAAVAEAVGATDAVVYLNGPDAALARHLEEAVSAAEDVLPVVPQVVAGPDEYRAGEPTAALEALEGADRVEPRIGPPGPEEHGLYGRPTAVHTPRTVAAVRRAVAEPAAVPDDAADPGTRLFTVAGDVAAPATVELPSEASLETALSAVSIAGRRKMAVVGGPLGGVARDLDVGATAGSLRAADLGTDGAVEVLNESRCPLADAGERARFAATENSGRCVPGREGTKQLAELLRETYGGSLRSDDIRELARVMRRSSNCRLGASAPRPVTTAMETFEPEFRAHADGRCPAGTCTEEL